jgi:threonylcarbamoyladenosine tRNA methylthiotransferase MtaB
MKVFLDSVGCRLNQSEIEAFAGQFRAAGYELTAQAEGADLAIINTCAVTAAAASDSRQKARQAARAGAKEIVLTGCWVTLQPQAAQALPRVSRVAPNAQKDRLALDLLRLPQEDFDLEPLARQPLPGARLRTRAFIKAQDGCDNRCTFCVTTLARGSGRSRPAVEVLSDIHTAARGGSQEIVLTGVHLGSWGQDFDPPARLADLIAAVLRSGDTPRLRLSSLEPWDLDADFFALWQDGPVCRHLHLPLQSGNAATLRRMARKTTPQSFAALVEAARRAIPDAAITTDIIVGFPGESDAEFAESLRFVEAMEFAGGHVFAYSPRPGTAAARMPAQVDSAARKERSAQMRALLAQSEERYRRRFLGQVLPVLWESAAELGPRGWRMNGLSDNFLRVHAYAGERLWNQITPVRLTAIQGGQLYGEISLAS